MAVAKRPVSPRIDGTASRERVEEAFIAGGAPSIGSPPAPASDARKTPVLVRFAPEVLRRVDAAAAHRGISRSAWVQFVISRALDAGEG